MEPRQPAIPPFLQRVILAPFDRVVYDVPMTREQLLARASQGAAEFKTSVNEAGFLAYYFPSRFYRRMFRLGGAVEAAGAGCRVATVVEIAPIHRVGLATLMLIWISAGVSLIPLPLGLFPIPVGLLINTLLYSLHYREICELRRFADELCATPPQSLRPL